MSARHHARSVRCLAAAGCVLLLASVARGQSRPATSRPVPTRGEASTVAIRPGEVLRYVARVPRFGAEGTAELRVTREGDRLLRLAFDLNARLIAVKVQDRTRSWIDPISFSTLRYTKSERSPLGSREEAITIDRQAGTWRDGRGSGGGLASAQPLDELSFLYFLRTLPLDLAQTLVLERHYDSARNPVEIEVLGRQQVTVLAGVFETIAVEMRVRDAGRFEGRGRVRLYLTDDAARIPVRIETSLPVAGSIVLDLRQSVPGEPL